MKKIDLVEKKFDPELEGEWGGRLRDNNIFMNTYIKEKFGDELHFLPFVSVMLAPLNLISPDSKLIIADYNSKIGYHKKEPEFNKYIEDFRSTRKRFTFFPISLRSLDEPGHAASILYDKVSNEVEIFDSIEESFIPYKKGLKEFFQEIYGKQVKIIYLTKCSLFGKFSLEKCFDEDYVYNSEGFCVIWVLWYLELRLKNRDLDRKLTINLAIKKLKKSTTRVCKLLRGYAQFVDSEISKYDLIEKKGELIIKPKTKSRFTKKELFNAFTIFVGVLGYIAGRLAFEKYRKNLISSRVNTEINK
jgi:hypothetical protein